MTTPITPDERIAWRDIATYREGEPYATVIPRLLDALDTAEAEVANAREACRTLGRIVDQQCIDIAKITRSEHLVAESGDADWGAIWDRGFELADRAEKAEAEVARLARPAPAWDEDTVAEAVESVLESDWHGEYTCDCTTERCPTVPCPTSTPVYVTSARDILAVVREHLPVKPDREAVIEAMSAALHVTTDRIPGLNPGPVLSADSASVVVAADAVLDLWPGESRATVQAEALRDAADEWHAEHYGTRPAAYKFLWDRADRLAAEGGDDRG